MILERTSQMLERIKLLKLKEVKTDKDGVISFKKQGLALRARANTWKIKKHNRFF